MRSNLVPIVAAVIALVFAGSAFYYWHGFGSSSGPVSGVIIDKFQRQAGTEAGDHVLGQGLNVLTGRSLEKEVFYFVLIRTEDGDEVEIEVPNDLFSKAVLGDTIHQVSADARPTLIQHTDQF